MKRARFLRVLMLCVMAVSLAASLAMAQKKKKGKEDTTPIIPVSSISDNDQVDQAINEILAGWQIGDIPLMHKHYSDEAVFVSGGYDPPVVGWTNYLTGYNVQRQRMTNVSMDRFNTLIRVKGTSAVSNYQWQFTAMVDGKQMWARGHSSLVWEKRDGKWLILHNHTSLVDQGAPQVQAPAAAKPKP